MNPNSFFFKLSAIFFQYLLLICVFFPLIYLTFLFLSDFDSNKIAIIRILFLSIAVGLPIVMLNAFAFEGFSHFDLKNYLKPHQKISVNISNKNLNKKEDFISNILKNKNWKFLNEDKNCVFFIKNNLILKDKIKIDYNFSNKENIQINIESKPSSILLIIDFARNYRNILTILKALGKNNN